VVITDVSGQPIGPIFKYQPYRMGPIGCPETSAMNYHYLPRGTPEERISHSLLGGSPKSRDDLRTLYGRVQFWVLKVVTVNAAVL